MAAVLNPKEFLELRSNVTILDVRSPKEYERGHIPQAVSMPLFTDEERAKVGTTYTRNGKDLAVILGLEFVGPKLAELVRFARKKANKQHEIALYCWRGGMRSGSVAWLLETAGFKVYLLRGGYKAYRTHLRYTLKVQDADIRLLGGMTGSGKTEILYKVKELGGQILDLEGYANHKGSAFGAIGQQKQPFAEMFENLLFDDWITLDFSRPIWVEDESKSIGSIFIPDELYDKMWNAILYRISLPKSYRINRLVNEYAGFSDELIKEAILKIEKRLGFDVSKKCLTALENRDYHQIVDLTLNYYDKAYLNQNGKRVSSIIDLNFEEGNSDDVARKIMMIV